MKGDALRKWGSTLNTCVHAHGNNVEFFMEVSHKNNYPLVQFLCVFKNNVPSKAFTISLGDSCLITLRKDRNFLLTKLIFIFILEELLSWFFFLLIYMQIVQTFVIFQIFWDIISIRNIQIATDCSVLTDSVFYALFSYFDESMGSIGGYEPWWSWITVDIMLIWI